MLERSIMRHHINTAKKASGASFYRASSRSAMIFGTRGPSFLLPQTCSAPLDAP